MLYDFMWYVLLHLQSKKSVIELLCFKKKIIEENKKNEVIEDGKDCNRYRQ